MADRAAIAAANANALAESLEAKACVSEAFEKSSLVTMPITLKPAELRSIAEALRAAAVWGLQEHQSANAAHLALEEARALAKALRSATLPALIRFRIRQLTQRAKP
jgi:hypothetical protein